MKSTQFLAAIFFANIMIQCFFALSNILHVSAAGGYFCALMMCGVIESKDKLIADHNKFIEALIEDLQA